jgi:hypothetical protein
MKYVLTLLLCAISLISYAVLPYQMRFHCENDTIKINSLLKDGASIQDKNPNSLISFYATKLTGTPYVAHTLEGDQEMLTINIDELDCTTFIESLIALTKTTLSDRNSWRDYAMNLENIRYRNGEMKDYASRLHYISDWIMDNTNRGNIREITSSIARSSYEIKTIDFMTKHRESYPSLKNDEIYDKIKNTEIGYRSHRIPMIKKTNLQFKNVKEALRNGDIIAITTKIEGLDVTHMGIVFFKGNNPYLLHASSTGGKVMVDSSDLAEMLRHSKNASGIRVIRVTN